MYWNPVTGPILLLIPTSEDLNSVAPTPMLNNYNSIKSKINKEDKELRFKAMFQPLESRALLLGKQKT
jgi:hypothetical protein